MLYVYGLYIFYIDDKEVWDFVNVYFEFMFYINCVKVVYKGNVYLLFVNLYIINQFFNKMLCFDEVWVFIELKVDKLIVDL